LIFAVAAAAVVVGLFFLLMADSVHFVAANSDGATVVLEGQSMQSGAPLLEGWSLSLDSFFTVEVPFYAFAVRIFGLRSDLVNAVPAAIAVAVVVAGSAVVGHRMSLRGKVAGLALLLSVLALPSPALAFFFLQGPWHVGSALFCVVAFVGASRHRFGWPAVGATVLLALGLLGDAQVLALGVLPVFVGGLVVGARSRSVRASLSGVAIAGGSVALAVVLRTIFDAIGTFTLVHANPTARVTQIGFNLRHLPTRFAGMFGVGTIPIGPNTTGSRVGAVDAVVLVIVIGAVVAGVVSVLRGVVCGDARLGIAPLSRSLDDLLLFGFVGDLGAFVVLASTGNGDYARYLTAGVIFSVILAARAIARIEVPRRSVAALGAMLVLLGGCAIGHALDLSARPVHRPADALGAYLKDHGLRNGLGDYWSASIVTTSTWGTVTVRPVISTPAGTLARYGRQSTSAWYRGQRFEFLVYDLHRPWHSVNATSARATFGPPAVELAEGTYRIYVFRRPVAISAVGFSNS
jgi:hypothetical protein